MTKRLIIALLLSLLGTTTYAQQWDRVNGSMQVKSGPSAPLVIIDQTASGQKILSLRANGTEICSATSSVFTCSGGFTVGGVILAPDGSASAPSYSFTTGTNYGLFWVDASNRIDVSMNGTSTYAFDGGGFFTALTGIAFGTIGSADVISAREGANHWFQKNSTNAQRASWANTYTSATNYEAFSVDWQTVPNTAIVGNRTAATGIGQALHLVGQNSSAANEYATLYLRGAGSLPLIRSGFLTSTLTNASSTAAGTWFQYGRLTNTATSGTNNIVSIEPTYNQASGTAANTDLLINRTQTAVGSGPQNLLDGQVGGVTQFRVNNTGAVFIDDVLVISATAPTVTSAGTSPSVAGTNTAAFRVNVGTGGTATTIVMAMPAATTGWNCDVTNLTAAAANRAAVRVVQQSSTTTAVTVQNQNVATGAATAFTASDIVAFGCMAY